MRVKPTEIRLVASLLEEEHPDAESLAKEIIARLDEKRMSDPVYTLGTMFHGVPLLWGPFSTANQAAKAASKLAMPVELPGRVIQLRRIDEQEK